MEWWIWCIGGGHQLGLSGEMMVAILSACGGVFGCCKMN